MLAVSELKGAFMKLGHRLVHVQACMLLVHLTDDLREKDKTVLSSNSQDIPILTFEPGLRSQVRRSEASFCPIAAPWAQSGAPELSPVQFGQVHSYKFGIMLCPLT